MPARRARVFWERQLGPHRQHAFGAEARIHLLDAQERANQQAGGHQEHDGHRDLRDDEADRIRCVPRLGRRGRLHAGRSSRPPGARAARARCRSRSRSGTSRSLRTAGRAGRSEECPRSAASSAPAARRAEPTICEQNARRAADSREHEAFREHLPHDPFGAGAERQPHGELALTRQRTCEQQVRQVGARDQQHAQRAARAAPPASAAICVGHPVRSLWTRRRVPLLARRETRSRAIAR